MKFIRSIFSQDVKSGAIVRSLAAILGTVIHDEESGVVLGRAFFFGWRGQLYIIGYTGTLPLRPIAIAEKQLSYWRIRMGYASPHIPNFAIEK